MKPRRNLKRHENMVYQMVRKARGLTSAQVEQFIEITNDIGLEHLTETIPISLMNKNFLFKSEDGKYISADPRIIRTPNVVIDLSFVTAFWAFLKLYPKIDEDSYRFNVGMDIPIEFTSGNKIFKLIPHQVGTESFIKNVSKFDYKNSVYVVVVNSVETGLHYFDLYKDEKTVVYVALIEGSSLGEEAPEVSLYSKAESLQKKLK